ncbi:hypothetical protein GCM10022248_89980 [Nonomuraea soli]
MLGAACSVGAGVVPLLVPGSWPFGWRALIAAVVAGLAGAAGSYFGVVLTRQDQRAAARQAVQALLDPLVPPIPQQPHDAEPSVLELLTPHWCPTGFWGRQAEQKQWHAWCTDTGTGTGGKKGTAGGAASRLMMVDGPAGCGKTRFALRMARDMEPEWTVGWLKRGTGAALVEAAAAASRMRVLALVDDADTHADLGALLAALSGYSGTVALRVVLITRHGDTLEDALAGRLSERDSVLVTVLLKAAARLRLQPLGGSGDVIRWYGEAVSDFARAMRHPAPPVSDRVAPVQAGQTMVEILAQAMLTVLEPAASSPSPKPLNQVAKVLFEHEARWWRTSAALGRWALGPVDQVLLERVLVVLVLLAPADETAGAAALRRIPDLDGTPQAQVLRLLRWANALYPRGLGLHLGPDLLADWFITTRLTRLDDGEFARRLLVGLAGEQAGRVLTLLARAGEHYPAAHVLFEQLLDGDPILLAHHAIYAALTTEHRRKLDETTAAILARTALDIETITYLLQIVPTHALPVCALALTLQHLRHERATGHPQDVAIALESLGIAHRWLGHDREALAVTQEAVKLWRDLAANNPAHQPDLAATLGNLGIAHDRLGQYREAQGAAQEAVNLFRDLAADNPAHQPGLAATLDRLGTAHRRLGHDREALAAAQEAVNLWRDLPADNPAHQPGLAATLDNLGTAHDRLGHDREALAATQEAVNLWRDLAANNPAHQPNLATTLDNLGTAHDRLGHDREALAAAQEAVKLFRDLAANNPADQPGLARAVGNLGTVHHRLGHDREALAATQEAVKLWRDLAANNPAHQPGLATTLGNLGSTHDRLGHDREALAATQEAVNLWRDLAANNPAHRPDLATTLGNLGSTHHRLGQRSEGIAVWRKSVAIWRELAERLPDQYRQRYIDARAVLRRLEGD